MSGRVKILNFGSLNLDYVYSVKHFVRAGETISSRDMRVFCGGKGLNQSIALARAGADVYHAGAVGIADGMLLLENLSNSGVKAELTEKRDCPSGHAIIQVDDEGQNSILLYGGTNQTNSEDYIDRVLRNFSAGDFVLLQNEINLVGKIILKAKAIGLRVAINPSPMDEKIKELPLESVDYILLNEVEAAGLCGYTNTALLPAKLHEKFPQASILLTLGRQGAVYWEAGAAKPISHGIYDVPVVDTTAAGDTFTGYFIAGIVLGNTSGEVLRLASVASSIAVSRKGASPSIPAMEEVETAELKLATESLEVHT